MTDIDDARNAMDNYLLDLWNGEIHDTLCQCQECLERENQRNLDAEYERD